MEITRSCRRLSAPLPPSPRLLRSRSTTPATPLPENNSCTPNSGQRAIKPRPKSTTKSRTNKNEENISPSILISSTQKKPQENTRFGNFLHRGSPLTTGTPKGARSVTSSPSAWALSPGRSSPEPPESAGSGGKRVKGGVSGVLKYFKQKKVSRVQEEEFHRFRVLQNRLLQWRFVNAKAEAPMAAVKGVAKAKIFCVWIRIFKMRKSIVEMQIQMERVKLEIKVYQIINPQIFLLNEWAKLERRNQESVCRMTRKLSSLSIRLPLVQDAKADVVSIYQALSTAMEVMDSIVAMITKFFSKQIETIFYLLTELTCTLEQDEEHLEEIEMAITLVSTLLAKEKSLQVHLIQATKESRRCQDSTAAGALEDTASATTALSRKDQGQSLAILLAKNHGKLDEGGSYLAWLSQTVPTLKSHDMMGIVDDFQDDMLNHKMLLNQQQQKVATDASNFA
ncbi:QWRF motif-containing protein 7-like [Corylus avellana]|uniref:QWRF motif-containing protein 7-like n=1 Tax=Corylus avellana TaxID=13451 RepID=UPI00286BB0D6|nr:QWRF motif-containing protein 7-like [Corylus avellana]